MTNSLKTPLTGATFDDLQRSSPSGRRWSAFALAQGVEQILPKVEVVDEEDVVKALRKRSALHRKFDELDGKVRKRTEEAEEEQRQAAAARHRTEELRKAKQALEAKHELQMTEILRQQEILRNLRTQVRYHQKIAQTGGIPTEEPPPFKAGGKFDISRRLLLPLHRVPPDTPRSSSPFVPSRSSSPRHWQSSSARATPTPYSPSPSPLGFHSAETPLPEPDPSETESADGEAKVEMMAESFVRLCHPNGSEAILGRDGRLCFWRLGSGRWCSGRAVQLLTVLPESEAEHPWQFVSLDYSKNEVSADFVKDLKSPVPLRLHRTLTLAPDHVAEELLIERRRSSEVTLCVGQEEAAPESECDAAVSAAFPEGRTGVEFIPEVPGLGFPQTVWLPPSVRVWCTKRSFTVPGSAPFTDGCRPLDD